MRAKETRYRMSSTASTLYVEQRVCRDIKYLIISQSTVKPKATKSIYEIEGYRKRFDRWLCRKQGAERAASPADKADRRADEAGRAKGPVAIPESMDAGRKNEREREKRRKDDGYFCVTVSQCTVLIRSCNLPEGGVFM